MGLAGASSEALALTKTQYEEFLGNPEKLTAVRDALKASPWPGRSAAAAAHTDRKVAI